MNAKLIDNGVEVEIEELTEEGIRDAIVAIGYLKEELEEALQAEQLREEAVEGCYYGDEDACEGELWECETCGEQYCEHHWHDTDKGRNVECVACERERLDAAKA